MRWILAAWVVLAFSGVACSSKDRVTEGDRQLSHQNVGAAKVIQEKTSDPEVITPAKDIEANSAQQLENWGPAKEPKPYSPAESQKTREKSKEEHKESPFWPVAMGVLGTVLGWASRATPLGNIPFLGQLISNLSPRLANGASKNEAVALGLQTALDVGRDELDKLSLRIKEQLADKPAIAAMIPDGHLLVDIVRRVLADKGLLDANTRLYNKNDTGVA